MKIKSIFILIFLFLSAFSIFGQQIPDSFRLVYEQDFDQVQSWNDFEFSDPDAWLLVHSGKLSYLTLAGESKYRGRVRSPFNIALIKDLLIGDFILELDVVQTGEEYGHRDLCFFFGLKDPSNFYYVHIASKADENANNIFIVNDEPRTSIGTKTTEGTAWGDTKTTHKVRIMRQIESGEIKVYFDDMSKPIMEATDKHFDIGYIGFGSFDDIGIFDNIKVYAPEIYPEKNFLF